MKTYFSVKERLLVILITIIIGGILAFGTYEECIDHPDLINTVVDILIVIDILITMGFYIYFSNLIETNNIKKDLNNLNSENEILKNKISSMNSDIKTSLKAINELNTIKK